MVGRPELPYCGRPLYLVSHGTQKTISRSVAKEIEVAGGLTGIPRTHIAAVQFEVLRRRLRTNALRIALRYR